MLVRVRRWCCEGHAFRLAFLEDRVSAGLSAQCIWEIGGVVGNSAGWGCGYSGHV